MKRRKPEEDYVGWAARLGIVYLLTGRRDFFELWALRQVHRAMSDEEFVTYMEEEFFK
jgi:hypothetical protein